MYKQAPTFVQRNSSLGDSSAVNLSNMSDTEAELESFNYDNCIVTRHDDSDESCTTNLVLPEPENTLNEPSQQPETDESDFEITRETLEEADLTPEDSFFFVLGMLNRVEKYLNKLEEGTLAV